MRKKIFKSLEPGINGRIIVKNSPGRGRGVFALEDIAIGTLIESCPMLVFGPKHWPNVQEGPIAPYVFAWNRGSALALGVTSLLNHSEHPNTEVVLKYELGASELWATRDIKRGEEIIIHYGPNYKAEWMTKSKKSER